MVSVCRHRLGVLLPCLMPRSLPTPLHRRVRRLSQTCHRGPSPRHHRSSTGVAGSRRRSVWRRSAWRCRETTPGMVLSDSRLRASTRTRTRTRTRPSPHDPRARRTGRAPVPSAPRSAPGSGRPRRGRSPSAWAPAPGCSRRCRPAGAWAGSRGPTPTRAPWSAHGTTPTGSAWTGSEVTGPGLRPPGRADLVVRNPPWLPARPTSALELGVHDEDGAMLREFLRGPAAGLRPAARAGWSSPIWPNTSVCASATGCRI